MSNLEDNSTESTLETMLKDLKTQLMRTIKKRSKTSLCVFTILVYVNSTVNQYGKHGTRLYGITRERNDRLDYEKSRKV